jgi:hypothetical protein
VFDWHWDWLFLICVISHWCGSPILDRQNGLFLLPWLWIFWLQFHGVYTFWALTALPLWVRSEFDKGK